MAKLVHLFLTPRQADLVHWSLLLSKLDLQNWNQRTGESPYIDDRDVKIVIDKVIRSKRKAHVTGGGGLFV